MLDFAVLTLYPTKERITNDMYLSVSAVKVINAFVGGGTLKPEMQWGC